MASPFEAMMKIAFEKALENIPPETIEQIRQIGHFTLAVKAQLDRIEAQQRMIMNALGIGQEVDNGRQLEVSGSGSADVGDRSDH